MLDFWRLPAFRVCLATLMASVALLLPLLVRTPIEIRGLDKLMPLQVVVMFVAIALVSSALVHRYRHDPKGPARLIVGVASRAFDFITANLYLMLFTGAAVPLCFMAFSVPLPMQDSAFARLDSALGFDWQYWLGQTNSHPALGKILIWSYESFVPQMFAITALFSMTGRTRELWDFMVLVTLTCLAAIIVSAIVPAIGPYGYYNPDPYSFAALDQMLPGVGRFHLANVTAVHSGQLPVLDVMGNHGLVTFPSYHAVLAFALAYVVRRDTWLFVPSLVLNGLMLVSTVPVGGHYLVDLFGGLAIFLATVALLDWVNGRASLWNVLRCRMHRAPVNFGLARPSLSDPQA